MRIISVNIGNTNIEFDNNMWTGHENIYVNGELISRKFSFFGVDHNFEVKEDGEWVEYVLTTGIGWMGFTVDLTRNGIKIVNSQGHGSIVNICDSNLRSYSLDELV